MTYKLLVVLILNSLLSISNAVKYELVAGRIPCPAARRLALECSKNSMCLGFRQQGGELKVLVKKEIMLSTVPSDFYLSKEAKAFRKNLIEIVKFKDRGILITKMKKEKRIFLAMIPAYDSRNNSNPKTPKYVTNYNFNIGVEMLYSFVKTQNTTFRFGCANIIHSNYHNCVLVKENSFFISCDNLERTEIGSPSLEWYWNEPKICAKFSDAWSRSIFVRFE